MMREREIDNLVCQGGTEAVQKLTDALLNSHWPDCIRLANALAEIGDEAARAGLVRALSGRRHHIRSAAIKALVRIGGSDVRKAISFLENDPAYEVRQDVVEAMNYLGTNSAQDHGDSDE